MHQLLLPKQCGSEISSRAALQAMHANIKPGQLGMVDSLKLFVQALNGCLAWKVVRKRRSSQLSNIGYGRQVGIPCVTTQRFLVWSESLFSLCWTALHTGLVVHTV